MIVKGLCDTEPLSQSFLSLSVFPNAFSHLEMGTSNLPVSFVFGINGLDDLTISNFL